MKGQSPGWLGECWLDGYGLRLPALTGTEVMAPEQFKSLALIANSVVPVTVVAGLRVPVVRIPLGVTANWFQVGLLNQWLGLPNRSDLVITIPGGWYGAPRTDPTADLPDLGTLTLWNGVTALQVAGTKCASLTVALSQLGETVGAELVFWGATIYEVGFSRTVLPFLQSPARSQNCAHNLAVNPTAWRLALQNPLRANGILHALPPSVRFYGAEEVNAGTFQAAATLTFQATAAIPANFVTPVQFYFLVHPPGGAGVKLIVTNPLVQNLSGFAFQRPRQKTTWPVLCRGNPDGTSPVLIQAA